MTCERVIEAIVGASRREAAECFEVNVASAITAARRSRMAETWRTTILADLRCTRSSGKPSFP